MPSFREFTNTHKHFCCVLIQTSKLLIARTHQDCDYSPIDCMCKTECISSYIPPPVQLPEKKRKGLEDFGVGSRDMLPRLWSQCQPHPPCQLISCTFFEPGIATNPLLGHALQTSPVVKRQQHHRSGGIAEGFTSFLRLEIPQEITQLCDHCTW